MRFTAEEFARRTLAILVGVGQYQTPGLRELSALADVQRLHSALTSPAACGIPCENILLLANHEATLGRVTAELRRLAQSTGPESMLFVYFSGHGHRRDDTFSFHLFDTDPEDPAQTGLTAPLVADCLASCSARGVLVIADCCVGAGFAETAPPFFFELGEKEFRLAISASRATQASWEIPDEGGSLFCKHFVDILAGKTAAGLNPGEITYLGLVEGLQFALDEDLAERSDAVPRQEVVANGSLVSDPLLFVSARGALKRLTVETGRVTRTYLRRILRRSVLGAVAGLLLVAGLYSAWLGAHEYAVADFNGTTIYRGLPGWSGFGYPELLFRLSADTETYDLSGPLAPTTGLGRNGALVVLGTGRILPALDDQVNPVLRAERLADGGRRREAREILNSVYGTGSQRLSPSLGISAAMLRVRLAPPNWVPRLRRAARGPSIEERHSAILALLELDPPSAFQLLTADLDPRHAPQLDHREALLNLEPPCSTDGAAYLRAWLKSQEAHNVIPYLLLAWHHLDCPVSVDDVLALASQPDLTVAEQAGTWARLRGFDRPRTVLESTRLELEQAAAFAVGWGKLPCQEGWFPSLDRATPAAKALVFRHAAESCPWATIETHADANSLLLLIRSSRSAEPIAELQVPAPLESFNRPEAWAFAPALKLLVHLGAREAEPFLLTQILHGELTSFATPALQAAQALDIPWQPGQGFFRGTNHEGFALEYYLWLRKTDPAAASRIATERVLSQRFPYFIQYAAMLNQSPLAPASLRALLDERGAASIAAADLLAMFGRPEDLDHLAAHPDPTIRRALETHGAFNRSMQDWLLRPRPASFDLLVYRPGLTRDVDLIATIGREVAKLQPADRCLLLTLEQSMRAMRGGLGNLEVQPEGVQLWLERESQGCGP